MKLASCTLLAIAGLSGSPSHAGPPPAFATNDVFLVSAVLPPPGGGCSRPGILRVDPVTWQTSVLRWLDDAPSFGGRAVYDPWRDRLVMRHSGATLLLVDATGGSTTLTYSLPWTPLLLATTRDGRIYLVRNSSGPTSPNFGYIDAAGSSHILMDQTGVSPYFFPAVIDAVTYDRLTNSLIVATRPGSPDVEFTQIPLSADGSRVVGTPVSVAFTVSPNGPKIVGFSHGPGGSIFAKADDNSSATIPRMILLYPQTMTAQAFASSGYFGVGGEVAGAYLSANNLAIVLDSLSDQLRTFAQGEVGEGTILPSTGVSGCGSGELAQFVPIGPRACAGDANGDGAVNFLDLNAVLSDFGLSGHALAGDVNHDGVVDFLDLNIVLSFFGSDC